jgi:hypothetical protein
LLRSTLFGGRLSELDGAFLVLGVLSVLGLGVSVVGFCGLSVLIGARLSGLTYGFSARFSSVANVFRPPGALFGLGEPGAGPGPGAGLRDLKAARPKTSSRMCAASSATALRQP